MTGYRETKEAELGALLFGAQNVKQRHLDENIERPMRVENSSPVTPTSQSQRSILLGEELHEAGLETKEGEGTLPLDVGRKEIGR